MDNDRMLLEKAAKAAGMPINCHDGWNWVDNVGVEKAWGLWNGVISPTISNPNPRPNPTRWNPLQNDGDALRLAVKLKMDIVYDFDRVMVVYGDGDATLTTEYFYDLPTPTDQYAATRRAIVRAAAEIGKDMK